METAAPSSEDFKSSVPPNKKILFFIALRYVKDRDELDEGLKLWDTDFEYFLVALKAKKLFNTSRD